MHILGYEKLLHLLLYFRSEVETELPLATGVAVGCLISIMGVKVAKTLILWVRSYAKPSAYGKTSQCLPTFPDKYGSHPEMFMTHMPDT